ncbi:MAG: DUF692 family multinuclear iron-containing protein [Rhodothermales bacterium]
MAEKSNRFSAADELPSLGVGITYSSVVEPLIRRHASVFDVVEVEPQTTWLPTSDPKNPYRIADGTLDHLAALPGRKLVHSIGTPVGGSVRPDPAQLKLLRKIIERFDSPYISDHLSFNKTPEFATGFFLPPRQTPEGVEIVVRSIQDLQESLPVPVAVETGVNYLRPRPDELPDGGFVASVVEGADCGLLLDLHNIFCNALNGRQPVGDFLSQLPLDRVWEIHLAGGMEMDGFWLDAHSGAIPDPLFDIAKDVVASLPNLKAIIFEIFPSFVSSVGDDVILAQVERLHDLWDIRSTAPETPPRVSRPVNADTLRPGSSRDLSQPGTVSATWERALGGLVIGRPGSEEDLMTRELSEDPGIEIINKMICEFRASMVVGVLRLTSRLMMLALGPDVFRVVLADFWSKSPPELFASEEAREFAVYLRDLDLRVPQLAKVLEFELAVLETMVDETARVVTFDFDPLPLLRALAEGRLPDAPGSVGRFEIEVTPDGPVAASGLDLDAVQQAFPYH